MKLTDLLGGKYNAAEWEAKGYQIPKFDIQAVRERTAKEPVWYTSEVVTSSAPSLLPSSTTP